MGIALGDLPIPDWALSGDRDRDILISNAAFQFEVFLLRPNVLNS